MNRLKTEFDRFLVRENKLNVLGDTDTVKPLVQQQRDRVYLELNRLMDRAAGIRRLQKHLLAVFELAEKIDFYVKPSTRKERGHEDMPPEHLAILKLAQHSGASKVRRCDTGEIVRVNHLDVAFEGLSDRRTLFFFSTAPRPGVYAFPLDNREVSLSPVYEPITSEEKK